MPMPAQAKTGYSQQLVPHTSLRIYTVMMRDRDSAKIGVVSIKTR